MTIIMPYDSSPTMKTCNTESYNKRIMHDYLTLWHVTVELNMTKTIKSKHDIDEPHTHATDNEYKYLLLYPILLE